MEDIQGCPQGSVMSPGAGYSPSKDNLLNRLNSTPCLPSCFADDLSLVSSGICLNTVTGNMQEGLNICEKWGQEYGLTFCSRKYVALLFTRKRGIKPKVLRLGGKELKYVDSACCLGIQYDNRLLFTEHIRSRVSKAKGLLMNSRRMIGCKYGPKPEYHLYLWKNIILPMLTYGAVVWHGAVAKKGNADMLRRVQSLALRLIAPVRRSTPTSMLQMAYGSMPIELEIEAAAVAQWHSIRKIDYSDLLMTPGGHRFKLEKKLPNELKGENDCCPLTEIWHKNFKLYTHRTPIILQWGTWYAYVCGVVHDGRVGSGAIVYRNGKQVATFKHRLPGGNITTAEMTIIIQVSNYLEARHDGYPVKLISGNVNTLSYMGATKSTSLSQINAINALNLLGIETEIWFSHKCNGLHEAKENAIAACQQDSSSIAFTKKEIKCVIENTYVGLWTERWKKQPDCRQSKIFWSAPDKMLTKQLLKMTRERVGFAIRLWSGHSYFRRHDRLCGANRVASCRYCTAAEETPEHLILYCEYFKDVRAKYTQGGGLKVNPEQALSIAFEAGLVQAEKEERESDLDISLHRS